MAIHSNYYVYCNRKPVWYHLTMWNNVGPFLSCNAYIRKMLIALCFSLNCYTGWLLSLGHRKLSKLCAILIHIKYTKTACRPFNTVLNGSMSITCVCGLVCVCVCVCVCVLFKICPNIIVLVLNLDSACWK